MDVLDATARFHLTIPEQFQGMKDLDSKAFVEIPKRDIVDPSAYRRWLVDEMEVPWMTGFNFRNEFYYANHLFNEQSGIYGWFGDI